MHATYNKSSFECLATEGKVKLTALRSNLNLIVSNLRAIFADYLGVELSAVDETQAIEKLERELEILDSRSDQPLQHEDVTGLLKSQKLFLNFVKLLYRSPPTLEHTLNDLLALSEGFLNQVLVLQTELNLCKEEIQSLKGALSQLTDRFHCLEDENATTKEECASLRQENATTKEECASLRQECVSLRKECVSLRQECVCLRKENATTKEECPSLKRKLGSRIDSLVDIVYSLKKENKQEGNTLGLRDYIREGTDLLINEFGQEYGIDEKSLRWRYLSDELKDEGSTTYTNLNRFLLKYNLEVPHLKSLMKERFRINKPVHTRLPIKRARELKEEDVSFKYVSIDVVERCIRAHKILLKKYLHEDDL